MNNDGDSRLATPAKYQNKYVQMYVSCSLAPLARGESPLSFKNYIQFKHILSWFTYFIIFFLDM